MKEKQRAAESHSFKMRCKAAALEQHIAAVLIPMLIKSLPTRSSSLHTGSHSGVERDFSGNEPVVNE